MGYVVDSSSGWAWTAEAGIFLSLAALSKFKSERLKSVDANDVTAVCHYVEQGGSAPAVDVHSDGDLS